MDYWSGCWSSRQEISGLAPLLWWTSCRTAVSLSPWKSFTLCSNIWRVCSKLMWEDLTWLVEKGKTWKLCNYIQFMNCYIIIFLWLLTWKKTQKCLITITLFPLIWKSKKVGIFIQRSKVRYTHKYSYLKPEFVVKLVWNFLLCSKHIFLLIARQNQTSFNFMFMPSGMPEINQTLCFEEDFRQHGNKMMPINHKKFQIMEFF